MHRLNKLDKLRKEIHEWIPSDFQMSIFGLDEKGPDGKKETLWKFEKKVVLLAGPPGVGKSTYYKNVLKNQGYVLISDDALMYTGNCATLLESIKDKKTVSAYEERYEDMCIDYVGKFIGDVLQKLTTTYGVNVAIENNQLTQSYIDKFLDLDYSVELVLFYADSDLAYDSLKTRSEITLGKESHTRIARPIIYRDFVGREKDYRLTFIHRLCGNISFLYFNKIYLEKNNVNYKIVKRLKHKNGVNSLREEPQKEEGLIKLTMYIFNLIEQHSLNYVLDDTLLTVYNFFKDIKHRIR